MKTVTKTAYGGPEILQIEEVEKPAIVAGNLLIKVIANSVNPADWHILHGKPYFARLEYGLFRPNSKTFGTAFAGIVEEVGENVTGIRVGDRVFRWTLKAGSFAEYISIEATACGLMPNAVDFAEMACISLAGTTTLQALLKHGKLKEGETVLINGSAGGVGHLAVQIAKASGAVVTAVCSSNNFAFVKSLGADHVIPYDHENIFHHNGIYDLIVDTYGNLSYNDYKRMGKRGVVVGFTSVTHMISILVQRIFGDFLLTQFTVKSEKRDLNTLASFIQNGKINVHIDRTYSYMEIAKAITFIDKMHTRGKLRSTGEVDVKDCNRASKIQLHNFILVLFN